MTILLWILVFLGTFAAMEGMAWFTHKYIMHGLLWKLHKDHHHKDHSHWWERNDLFFIFYALVSIGFFLLWRYEDVWIGLPIGLGILAYGITYFTVHDIFIHQRFKMFRNANNFSKKWDVIGANPTGQGNVPGNGTGSDGSVSDYLWIRLNADGCVEFIGTSLFWNNFCIVFSEYGKRLLGVNDSFLRKVAKVQPAGEFEYIMSVTLLLNGSLRYDMFDANLNVLLLTALGYDILDRTVKITGDYPLFQNLDHRYFVSVETDLLVSQAIKVVDGKQTIDRSIAKIFFPTNCKVLLQSEDGVLREDIDFEITSLIGQHAFVKKTQPSRQWTALQTSYDLRFYRFHLYVTYRYFKTPENKWVFTRMKYPMPKENSWDLALEFISKV